MPKWKDINNNLREAVVAYELGVDYKAISQQFMSQSEIILKWKSL